MTGALGGVIRRGVVVLAALRREYEARLYRDEACAQAIRLISGRRVGVVGGRDHDGAVARRYRSRSGRPALWLRPGTGDAAIWGEVNVRGVYESPWAIPDGARVLDLGGHTGYFARWALERWPVSEVVSVEPDAANADVLARNLAAVGDDRWRLVRAAAATEDGRASFAGGRGAASGLATGGEDEVRTVDALPLLAACDLAKIDIEGGEWGLLADPRFCDHAPAMMVLEYHSTDGVDEPAARARRALTACGYEVRDGHGEELPGVGVLWARKPS